MKKFCFYISLATVLSLTIMLYNNVANASELKVTSKTFKNGDTLSLNQVYNGFGCSGNNLSPEISWHGAPKETKSYIVTAYDPDAPTGSGWWHWTVFNIPSSINSLEEGIGIKSKLPEGAIEGKTDFAQNGFGGACPPKGNKPHKYIFTVYAMPDETINLDANAPGAMVGFFANSNFLSKGSIAAYYSR